MAYQTLTQSQIQPSALNPRKVFNDTTIEELAQSIKTDGLLQNLVVLKPKGKSKKHNIVAGERRFRAISYLIEKGDLPKDYPIAVEIKENLTDDEALRISTVENIQRENLSPLEEATALAMLVRNGDMLDAMVAQTGLSVTTIRRRLSLLNLTDKVKEALSEKHITLAQAEALTIGKPEDQEEVLEDVMEGYYSAADDIKNKLLGDLPTLSMAIFPKDNYTGTFTHDLFAEDNTTYFDDVDQFFELQRQAAETLVAEYAKTHDWAELETGYSFSSWEYGQAEDGEKGGVVVFLSRDGSVTIHEGLTKTQISTATRQALKEKEKSFYAVPVRRYISMHKSLAVQATLLQHPRKAKELAVALKLARFNPHNCLQHLELQEVAPLALTVINGVAETLISHLNIPKSETRQAWETIGHHFHVNEEAAYDAIQTLSDKQLDEILGFLTICEFGQPVADRLDTNPETMFNKIAQDIAVDMNEYWTPDVEFLKRRNRLQLQQIIQTAGLSGYLGSAADYKKGELVTSMTKFFQRAKMTQNPTDEETKAASWLPEAMAFPAIDPDQKDYGQEHNEEIFEEDETDDIVD